jgi:hypothetical protein
MFPIRSRAARAVAFATGSISVLSLAAAGTGIGP